MADDELTHRIREEVEHILSARYPVAFTVLGKLLEESQHGLEFETFAIGNPCKLRGLAHAVRELLDLRPTAIAFLQQLSRSPRFSQCFIRECPDAAVSVLGKVSTDYTTYSSLGLNLVCSWNRQTSPMPSTCEEIATQAANAFLERPSDPQLWSLYKLGRSYTNLSDLLDHKVCCRLQTQLIDLARRKEIVSGTLSIALLHRLRNARRQDFGEADQFFAGDNTVKILHWVLLQIPLIPRSAKIIAAPEIEDLLNVIGDFASILGNDVISTWLARHDSGSVVTKLCCLSADSRLTVTARWKIARIVQKNQLLAKPQVGSALSLDELMADILSDSSGVMSGLDCLDLGQNANNTVPSLSATNRILTKILGLAVERQVDTCDVNSYLTATTILKTYRMAVATDPVVRAQVSAWLVQTDEHSLMNVLSISSGEFDCRPHQFCPRSSASQRHGLQAEISRLIMTCLTVDSNALEAQFVVRILDAHHLLIIDKPNKCTAWRSSRPNTVPLPRAVVTCTPAGPGMSNSWIADVQAMVNAESRVRQDSVVHFIQQLCHDLEERCQTAEAPWLQEQRVRQDLEERMSKLHQELHLLQTNHRGLEVAFQGEKGEKARLEISLRNQNDLADDLQRQVEALQAQANTDSTRYAEEISHQREQVFEQQQQMEVLQNASIAQQRQHMIELDIAHAANVDLEIATGADLEEAHNKIGEQQGVLERLQADFEHVKAELHIASKALRDLTQTCTMQRSRIDAMTEEKAQMFEKHESASREALRTEITVKELTTNLQELRLRHDKTAEQFVTDQEANQAEAASRIRGLIAQHTEELRELREDHEAALDHAGRKTQALRNQYDEQLVKLRNHMTQQETHLAQKRRDLSMANQTNADLEVILAEKEEQLESLLLSMKTSMMQALGTRSKPKSKTPRKSGLVHKNPHGSPHSKPATPRTPAIAPVDDGEDTSIACTLPRALGEDLQEETIIEPASTGSSFAGGPTPKRHKPHQRPFKVPTIKPPRLSRKADVLIVASPGHRQALQDVSKVRANRSPVKSGRRQSLRVSAKKLSQPAPVLRKIIPDPIEEDFGDDDFGSELLTSTQFSPSKSAFRVAGAGFNDGTTMDV